IELGAIAAQAGEIGPQAELAAEDRAIEDVIVIDHRMDDRNLLLTVRAREPIEIHRACVEEAALAASLEVDLRRHEVRRGCQETAGLETAVEAVVLEVGAVGDQRPIPAVDPLVAQPELARRLDAAAEIAKARQVALVEECLLVELEDAGAAD